VTAPDVVELAARVEVTMMRLEDARDELATVLRDLERLRPAALLRAAAQDYREHVHDEHVEVTPVGQAIVVPTGDDVVRLHAERACSWLERRADLMGEATDHE
jgi:hypothetical protein